MIITTGFKSLLVNKLNKLKNCNNIQTFSDENWGTFFCDGTSIAKFLV